MPDRYAFGPFQLDCQTRELRRGDQQVPLTPKAFDLLTVLVTSGGSAIAKDALMKRVWTDSFVAEDTLTQNIATLRKTLGDSPEHAHYIVTVPRYGYRFAAAVRPIAESGVSAPAPGGFAPPATRRVAAIAVFLVTVVMVATLATVFPRPAPSSAEPVRFEVPAPPGTSFSQSASFPAVSPDGRTIAFLAARPGEDTRVWVRSLDSVAPRELPGTAGALGPFWSPDSRSLAFFANGALKKVGVSGEAPETVCDCGSAGVQSGSWHANGTILFSRPDGIYRVSTAGGAFARVTSINAARGETAHVLPQFLPDGRHFLYTVRVAAEGSFESWIMVRSIDAADDRRLLSAESQAVYTESGELVFVRNGELMAERFDAGRLTALGDPAPVPGADRVGVNPASPRGMFSISRQTHPAVLAYRATPEKQLSWFDRGGTALGTIGDPTDLNPALSHDGRHVAVSREDGSRRTRSIWILDVDRSGVGSQATSGGRDSCPIWSPDDTAIAFARGAPNEGAVYRQSVVPAAGPLPLPHDVKGCPLDWSTDGRDVLVATIGAHPPRANGLWIASVSAGDRAVPLADTDPPGPRGPRGRISPNGRWLAYERDDGGHREIYVTAVSDSGRLWKVSLHGGIEPQWRGDGRELFYIAADRNLMVVPVVTGPTFEAGTPVALFVTELDPLGTPIAGRNQYVATADGLRFLLRQPKRDAPPASITVAVNWTAALKR